MLEIPDFLEPLEVISRPLPKQAIEAVLELRESAVPALIEVIEKAPALMLAEEVPEDYMLLDYAMHLLAELGETSAYRPMVGVARLPELDELIGDGITEDLPKLLAAVWDGDCDPLFELIADPLANEFARGAGIQALGILHHTGRLERKALFGATLHLYENCLEPQPGHIWDAWVMLVADFGFAEFSDQISKLYRKGLADPGFQPEASALKDLHAPEPDQKTLDRHYKSYTTVVEELSHWVCFSDRGIQAEIRNQVATPSAKQGREDELETLDNTDHGSARLPESLSAPETQVRGWPKVGRNDPCPCGSGRKYKKCCLA